MPETKSIKMIGTMILNGATNLWAQFESIDYPVDRYFILDNSMGKDKDVTQMIYDLKSDIASFGHEYIKEMVVIRNRLNVGFSGSVNQIIKQNTDCPYWCILSVDWHPKPGQLKKLAQRLEDPFVGILCDETQNGYSAMVFTPELLYEVGYLDENFFPAYYEDNDHRYRMKLAGLEWEYLPLKYKHKISSTLKSNLEFQKKNQMTFAENGRYYIEKWGGLPGQEQYDTPFNMDLPLDYWLYDPVRSERQRWI
jgi:GT2 family glycosyltransferase